MEQLFTFSSGRISPIPECSRDALMSELLKEEFGGELRQPDASTAELLKQYGFCWDPLSEPGYLTFKPYAAFMVEATKHRLWKQVRDFCRHNSIPLQRISGGDLYSMKSELMKEHVALAEEVGMYGEGFLTVSNDQLLRFSGCSNKLSLLKGTPFDHAPLPFGIFEISNSYRYEKAEEVELLKRNRKFHLPELHIINKDLDGGLQILLKGHEQIDDVMKKHGLEYIMLFSTTKRFVNDHVWFIEKLCEGCEHPPVVHVFDGETCENGIVFDVEYKAQMQNGALLEIATLQIDEGSTGFSYDIKYRGKPVTTIHAVFFASSVERTIYTYLNLVASQASTQSTAQTGTRTGGAMIPFWLAPVHCRIIPESAQFERDAEKVMDQLNRLYRVELDDRDITVQRKTEDAIRLQIPYIIKVGSEVLLYDKDHKGFMLSDLASLLSGQPDDSFGLGQFSPERLSQRVLF